ncbi:ubiquitin carboxyl-terminal hydrolase [Spatholobus suberectus]|nr:ubiquitin carboxyl-terminal hydrolase [Spatholobus suberectus]
MGIALGDSPTKARMGIACGGNRVDVNHYAKSGAWKRKVKVLYTVLYSSNSDFEILLHLRKEEEHQKIGVSGISMLWFLRGFGCVLSNVSLYDCLCVWYRGSPLGHNE